MGGDRLAADRRGSYDLLLLAWPSPVVALNRAAALAIPGRPGGGAGSSRRLELGALATSHYLPAARADLLRRLNRPGEAAAPYRLALELVDNEVERSFLQSRLDALTTPAAASRGGRLPPRQRPDTRRPPGLGSPA